MEIFMKGMFLWKHHNITFLVVTLQQFENHHCVHNKQSTRIEFLDQWRIIIKGEIDAHPLQIVIHYFLY